MSLRPIDAIVLAGPTASGKSSAALALADALGKQGGAEIISMDSALVYRGMDIGTAKPSRMERAAVPHHLIDILDPLHSYSAADFARDTSCLIRDIHARGRLPLIVGGTLLYLKALLEGLSEMPAADAQVRADIHQKAAALGWPALHAQLQTVDPATASRLSPNDSQRIGRALEVWTLTGHPLSVFHQSTRPAAPDWHIPVISLEPQDRAWLHARIAQRLDTMMADGFVDEVRALRARGDLHADLPSMRCVGYRQAWQGLDEGWSEAGIRERSIFATRQLAKRQITWLRSMRQRTVVAADSPNAAQQIRRAALQFVQTERSDLSALR
jgi:tRNA dimethylallyltransferase